MWQRLSRLIILLFLPAAYAAEINTAALLKATPENNPKCVEYYRYQGDLYCSTTAQQTAPLDPEVKTYEKQTIVFDDRPWQLAWGKKTEAITTVEYIPAGTDINNWHELITSQFIAGLPDSITPEAFAQRVIENLKESGFDPTVTFIETTPTSVLFEFRISSPDNMKQDELQRITKGSDGLYILHYAIKKADMGKVDREKWIGKLKQSTILQQSP